MESHSIHLFTPSINIFEGQEKFAEKLEKYSSEELNLLIHF